MHTIYLVACDAVAAGGGIYRYTLNAAGKLTPCSYFACEKPMYTVKRGNVLHTVIRYESEAHKTGAYFALPLDEVGEFGTPAALIGSRGEVPCHLTAVEDDIYLVNYVTGNVVKNGKTAVHHAGCGPNPVRQSTAHTHFVAPLPDGFLGVCDLGLDTLKIYDRGLVPVSEAKVPAGYGIRHFLTLKVGEGFEIYAVNELIPSISRFSYENGKATYLDTVDIPCAAQNPTAAAIRISADGRYLYTSVRAENILSVLERCEGEAPRLVQNVSCGGDGPRDFALCGEYLVCTNQNSNSVTVFAIKDGMIGQMTDEITLPTPLCVVV